MDQSISTAKNIVINPELAEQLAEAGYTVFPFLGPEETQQLADYYTNFQKEEPAHFYSSTHSKDVTFRKTTSDYIKQVISPLMPLHFKNYRLLGGAFVVKPAHGKGLLPPHQDWNIVDEEKTRSFNLWIPLTDVNVENGAVFVLPGSHIKIPTFRGPGIPSLFKTIEAQVWQSLQPLPMQAGSALFYDHALLHGSPVNTTDKARLGIVCGVIADDDEMQLCFAKHNTIEIYKADEHFFMEKDPAAGPADLALLKSVIPACTPLQERDYDSIFLGKPVVQKNWLKKLLGLN